MGCLMLIALSVLLAYMGVFAGTLLAYLVVFGISIAFYMSAFVGWFVAFFFLMFM